MNGDEKAYQRRLGALQTNLNLTLQNISTAQWAAQQLSNAAPESDRGRLASAAVSLEQLADSVDALTTTLYPVFNPDN